MRKQYPYPDYEYLRILSDIKMHGYNEANARTGVRTGVHAKKIPFVQTIHNMANGFPISTLKPVFWRGIVREFIWMFGMGSTNIKYLLEHNCHFWSEWPWQNYCKYLREQHSEFTEDENPISLKAFEEGILDGSIPAHWADCGPVYGQQFRDWYVPEGSSEYTEGSVDQLRQSIERLKEKPLCRRNIIVNWNPGEIPDMLLPPCHGNHIQFNAEKMPNGEWVLDLGVVFRSTDFILGFPFNQPFYGILLSVVAELTGMKPRLLSIMMNNCHVYDNHFLAMEEILHERINPYQDVDPKDIKFAFLGSSIEDLTNFEMYDLQGYEHMPKLRNSTPVAI